MDFYGLNLDGETINAIKYRFDLSYQEYVASGNPPDGFLDFLIDIVNESLTEDGSIAQEHISDTRDSMECLVDEARGEGFEEGYDEGYDEGLSYSPRPCYEGSDAVVRRIERAMEILDGQGDDVSAQDMALAYRHISDAYDITRDWLMEHGII